MEFWLSIIKILAIILFVGLALLTTWSYWRARVYWNFYSFRRRRTFSERNLGSASHNGSIILVQLSGLYRNHRTYSW